MGNLIICKKGSKTMVTAEKISVPVEGKPDLPAVLCKNESTKGVIVLQEWWGMNDQIQDEGKEIAENGKFTTLIPDLYRGKVTDDTEEAGHLMNNLDWPGALADIKACAKYLLTTGGCSKVGVTGFCMGGALSMAALGKVEEISAAAPFYGICGDDLCDPKTIKKPLQCHFGGKDAVAGFSDPEAQKKLKEKLESAKVEHDWYVYDDCGHAFTNKTGPLKTYNEEACKLALDRTYKFFDKHLK